MKTLRKRVQTLSDRVLMLEDFFSIMENDVEELEAKIESSANMNTDLIKRISAVDSNKHQLQGHVDRMDRQIERIERDLPSTWTRMRTLEGQLDLRTIIFAGIAGVEAIGIGVLTYLIWRHHE